MGFFSTLRMISAARSGRDDRVRAMLVGGGDPNVTSSSGVNALMHAAASGAVTVIAVLLEHGAELDRVDERGRTALIHAVRRKRADCVRALLDAGADATIADGEGRTAVDDARGSGDVTLLKLLMATSASRQRVGPKLPVQR